MKHITVVSMPKQAFVLRPVDEWARKVGCVAAASKGLGGSNCKEGL